MCVRAEEAGYEPAPGEKVSDAGLFFSFFVFSPHRLFLPFSHDRPLFIRTVFNGETSEE